MLLTLNDKIIIQILKINEELLIIPRDKFTKYYCARSYECLITENNVCWNYVITRTTDSDNSNFNFQLLFNNFLIFYLLHII